MSGAGCRKGLRCGRQELPQWKFLPGRAQVLGGGDEGGGGLGGGVPGASACSRRRSLIASLHPGDNCRRFSLRQAAIRPPPGVTPGHIASMSALHAAATPGGGGGGGGGGEGVSAHAQTATRPVKPAVPSARMNVFWIFFTREILLPDGAAKDFTAHAIYRNLRPTEICVATRPNRLNARSPSVALRCRPRD